MWHILFLNFFSARNSLLQRFPSILRSQHTYGHSNLFIESPRQSKQPTVLFIRYLEPHNLGSSSIWTTSSAFEKNTHKFKEKLFLITTPIANGMCAHVRHCPAAQIWNLISHHHLHFLFHSDFHPVLAFYHSSHQRPSFTKIRHHREERSVISHWNCSLGKCQAPSCFSWKCKMSREAPWVS